MEPEASAGSGHVNARAIFDAALEIESPEQRQAYVNEACAGNTELHDKVEALLRAYSEAGSFLERPAVTPIHTSALISSDPGISDSRERKPAAGPGTTIAGRYRLLELIGEGGMGAVWMAEQREPVKRRVALKLIKAGMDSRNVLSRFEAERQALALMDHPNIARVFDGGTAEHGYPFFVMELVKGIPLMQYCDERKLSIPERLALFVQICQAVQHAHQKGIIHRDLKPGNILVTELDGVPVPKVIDFGLAKALQGAQSLTERTLYTVFGGVVGTPLYMAPEQVGINALDVDTRTDIYALGVILYELLTGTTPLESQRLKQAAWDEIRRLIREEDPPKPSTRLSATNALPSIAASRHTEPAKLTKTVRGELDWIVLKALEKDRNRRYETANGFARDIERYLHDEPVLACPPSARYRLRKFLRKYRVPIAVAAGFVLLLAAASVVSTWQAVRATRAEALSRANEAKATAESARSKKNFMAASVAIVGVITKAALGSDDWAQLTPALRSKMSEDALKFYSSLLQEDSPDPSLRYETGVGYRSIALLHSSAGDLKRAEECYRKSIAILEGISAAAPAELQYRQQLAYSHRMLAACLARAGRTQEAASSYRTSAEMYAKLVAEAPKSFDFRNDLAACLVGWQRISEAVPYQEFLQGPARIPVQRARANLLVSLGRAAEAGQVYRELAVEYHKLAAEAPTVPEHRFQEGTCLFQVAQFLSQSGRHAEEEAAYLQSIVLLQRLAEEFPENVQYPRELGRSHNWLGLLLSSTGRNKDAEQHHRKAVALYGQIPKADPLQSHWYRRELVWSRLNLGALLSNMQRGPEAEAEFRAAAEICEALRAEKPTDPSYPAWGRDLSVRIGLLCTSTNRREEAQKWFAKASALAGSDPAAHKELVGLLAKQDLLPEAQAAAREADRLVTRSVGVDSANDAAPANLKAQILVGDLLREARDYDQALTKYSEVIAAKPELAEAWIGRGQCYLEKREFGMAAEDFSAVIELYQKRPAGSVVQPGELVTLGNVCRKYAELQAGNRSGRASALALKAVPLYQAATPEYEKLASNAGRWHDSWDFAIAYEQVAVALAQTNQTREAEKAWRDAQRIWLKLVAANNSVDHRWHLAVNCDGLGHVLKQSGRLEECAQSYQQALATWEKLAAETGEEDQRNHLMWTRQSLVEALRSQGKTAEADAIFPRAEAQYREAIRQHPNVAERYRQLADFLRDQGKLDEAIAAYSEVIARKPGDQEAWRQGGASYLRKGDLAAAAEYFTRAINQKPDDRWYWHERAFCYSVLGQHEKAIADLSKAIELGDVDPDQRIRRGQSYKALGQIQKAQADYDRAIELNPRFWESWHFRGHFQLDLRQWDQAAADFTKVIELEPKRSEGWTGRAFSHFHRQQWEKAIADFSKAIELAPQVHTNWAHRGHAYLALARWDKAAADFSKLVEQWPQDPGGWYFLAVAHAQMQRPKEALSDLRHAVAAGFNNLEQIRTDPKLESLRSDAEFRKLLQELMSAPNHSPDTSPSR